MDAVVTGNSSFPSKIYDEPGDASYQDIVLPSGGAPGRYVKEFWRRVSFLVKGQGRYISLAAKIVAVCLLIAYLGVLIYTWHKSGNSNVDWCNGYGLFVILLVFIVWCVLYYKLIKPYVIVDYVQDPYYRLVSDPVFIKYSRWFEWGVILVLLVAYIVFAVVDSGSETRRLISLLGWFLIILFGFLFSKHPDYVRWDTVCRGLILQVVVGLMTVRWETGRAIFGCFGHKVESFLEYAYSGAEFTYGKEIVRVLNVFAFQALSVLYFVAALVQMLFYWGWLQRACFTVGSVIQAIMGTTIIESINAITTIFLGMTEAPFIYKTYISVLTKSELHSIMAACFAAVSGSLLAAYATVGANPSHIVTASAMAAPGALAYSKLCYPETKTTRTSSENMTLHVSDDASLLDAACKAATSTAGIVLSIVANLVATISIVAFLDGILSWLGILVGAQGLTFEFLLGKIFIPLAWVLGVVPSEMEEVAKLIGLKTIVNEFVAYSRLGELKCQGKLTPRSEAIATFALCGFANPASVSMLVATLAGFAPNQRPVVIEVSLRAFVAGSFTSFLSAAFVGLAMPEKGFPGDSSSTNYTCPTTF